MLISVTKEDDIILETDASGRSWGGILYCKRGTIGYFGGTFTESVARSHVIFELELKSMALNVQACLPFITQCKSFTLKNDNISSVIMSNTRDSAKQKISSRALTYIIYIQRYLSVVPHNIIHIGTRQNLLSDIQKK